MNINYRFLFILLCYFNSVSCSYQDPGSKKRQQNIDSISCYSGVFNKTLAAKNDINYNSQAYMKGLDETLKNINFNIKKADAANMISILSDSLKIQNTFVNYKKGLSYLALNKTHSHIKTTSTGLQYEVIRAFPSQKLSKEDYIIIKIKGMTINGFTFIDTFNKGGEKLSIKSLPVGLQEGLQLMTEGSKYKFYIPTELAYGPVPPPGTPIKPMMPVIFEVELVKILR